MANIFNTDLVTENNIENESNYLNFIVEPYLDNINEYTYSSAGPGCSECNADYDINFNS